MTESNINTQIVCRVCSVAQGLDCFPKSNTGKYGRTTRCRLCTGVYLKQYQEANRDKLKLHKQQYYVENKVTLNAIGRADYKNNKDEYKARAKQWAAENKEKRVEIRKKYYRANLEMMAEKGRRNRELNPGLYRAHFKKRQQLKRNAMPKWADEAAIRAIYDECPRISKETGVKHHVDHYYPLQNKLVCGLHVEQNLRIITAFDNLSKGNSFPTEV